MPARLVLQMVCGLPGLCPVNPNCGPGTLICTLVEWEAKSFKIDDGGENGSDNGGGGDDDEAFLFFIQGQIQPVSKEASGTI